MERRKLLLGIGATAAGGAAAMGTGAFTSVEADRDVTVDVAGDAEAFLGLEPTEESNGKYAELDSSDVLVLNFDGSAEDVDGEGFNPNATTIVDDVFTVTNQGTQDVGVSIEFDYDGDANEHVDIDFVAQVPTDEDSLVDDGPVFLGVGESFNVGLEVVTEGGETLDGAIEDDEITIIADVADDGGDELQPVQNVDQGESYPTIGAAVGDAGPNENIVVGPGTYEGSVDIGVEGLTLEAADEGAATIEGDIFIGNNPSDPVSSDGTVIDGFKIVEPGLNGEGRGIGVTESNNVVIQNNEFEGFRTQITMDWAGADVENITIQGNTFENVNEDDGTAVGSTENVDGLDILNNEFDNNRNDIGTADSTTDVTIEGNDFTAGDSDSYVSVRADGLDAQTVIDDNEFTPDGLIITNGDENEFIVVEGGEFDPQE